MVLVNMMLYWWFTKTISFPANLVTFTEEILSGKLHICAVQRTNAKLDKSSMENRQYYFLKLNFSNHFFFIEVNFASKSVYDKRQYEYMILFNVGFMSVYSKSEDPRISYLSDVKKTLLHWIITWPQPAITCSKLTIKTLE